jgi:O-antigen ligase
MGLVRYALPALLLLYFLACSLQRRVFLLGIPFLMFMSYSVFFDKAKPFWVPARFDPVDHLMLWLVITWALYFDLLLPKRMRRMHERRLFGPRLVPPEELVLVVLAAYVLIEIVLTAVHYSGLGSAVTEAKSFTFLIVGYFLLRGIFCHAGRKETLDFVAAIVVVNTIAAGLFVLHQGLHLHVYNATEYQSIIFQGQRLTRSFYFMPQFLLLAIAYCVAKRKWGVFWFGVFVVTLAAVWVSYTRSLLLIAVIEVAVVLAVRLFKAHEAWPALKRGLQIVGVVVLLGALAFAVLPTQSNYILSRLHLATAKGGPIHDTNVQSRIDSFRTAYGYTGGDHLIGAGFVSAVQDPRVSNVDGLASDLVWVPTVYRLGLVGVVLLVLLFAAAGWRAARLSLTGGDDAEFLTLILFGTIVGVFLQGFVSWTVLDPARSSLALWFLAVLTAETCRRRAAAHPAVAIEPDDAFILERIVNE